MKKTEPTLFDVKFMELEKLKLDCHKHMCRLNDLKIVYRDWFDRRRQSFLDAIKTVQITYPQMVPTNILTLSHFKSLYLFTNKVPKSGKRINETPAKMEAFLSFWSQFCDLKSQSDILYERICTYCDSITRLREPKIKLEIDRLHKQFTVASSENYNFTHVNNEKDNLFTYRVAMPDHQYHGLVSFMPYLLQLATKVCYYCGKLHIEKE
ncbi:uncharacterized protein LOC121373883 [Gigantopelta aegis]|uniref:uncharacterized protein LOC121373883 n=1 Tax=Gigantopelta aegis TaxID=1735272 RepID=UPI001B889844|nr:uncharacterized protein LOC121373883 [Gigantopelta aegis]